MKKLLALIILAMLGFGGAFAAGTYLKAHDTEEAPKEPNKAEGAPVEPQAESVFEVGKVMAPVMYPDHVVYISLDLHIYLRWKRDESVIVNNMLRIKNEVLRMMIQEGQVGTLTTDPVDYATLSEKAKQAIKRAVKGEGIVDVKLDNIIRQEGPRH
jgi:hypothetical protein